MAPRVLLVEDDPLDAQIEQITLQSAGINVFHAATIVAAEAQAMTLLAPTAAPAPTAIVIDLRMPYPSHPALEGTVLAAVLTRRIQQHLLQPALLIGLTNYFSPEREEEALYAGCHQVLLKPLTNTHALWLINRLAQPLPPPVDDPGVRLYQKKAEEILDLIRRAQVPTTWTAADAQQILAALTGYPAPDPVDPARQAALLAALGGEHAARTTLHACSALLDEPYNRVLAALLAGSDRRAIRDHLIQTGYSRTHSYHCLSTLPARLGPCLQQRAATQPTANLDRLP